MFHGHFQAFVFIHKGSWCLKNNTEKRMTGSQVTYFIKGSLAGCQL